MEFTCFLICCKNMNMECALSQVPSMLCPAVCQHHMLGKERVALAIVWLEFGGRDRSPGEADSGECASMTCLAKSVWPLLLSGWSLEGVKSPRVRLTQEIQRDK